MANVAAQKNLPGETMTASLSSLDETESGRAVVAAADQPWPSPPRAYYTVFVVGLVVMFAEMDRGVMSLLIQPIKKDFHLSDTAIGLLLGLVFSLFYACCGLPLSRFIDRANRRDLLATALGVWSVATCFCGLAQNFVQLAIARLFLGAGESVNGPAIFSMISDSFPKERLTRAISLMQLGLTAGAAFSSIIGGVVIGLLIGSPDHHLGGLVIRWWQLVFVIIGIPGLLVALLLRATVKEPLRRGVVEAGKVSMANVFRYMAQHWKVYGPIMGSMAISGLGMGALTWAAAFYQRTYGWGPAKVGIVMGTAALPTTILGLFLGTMFYEHLVRKGHRDAALRVVVIGRTVALPFMIAMPLMPSAELALGASMMSSLLVGVTGASQNAALQIISPNNMRGQVNALFFFFYAVIGQGISPSLIGFFNDLIFHDESRLRWTLFYAAVLFSPASLVVLWLGIKPYAREVLRLEAAGAV